MNRQRKILITVIYNDLGIIVDTKAEELDLSANLQQTCNQLATDCISRQAAIEETWKEPSYTDPLNVLAELRDRIKDLPSAQSERKKGKWVPYLPKGLRYKCSECGSRYDTPWHFCPNCGADMRGEDNE